MLPKPFPWLIAIWKLFGTEHLLNSLALDRVALARLRVMCNLGGRVCLNSQLMLNEECLHSFIWCMPFPRLECPSLCSLLQCTLHWAAFELHLESSADPECSDTGSVGCACLIHKQFASRCNSRYWF